MSSRAEEIFADALELPVETWESFLAQACGGDAEIRAQVVAMLSDHVAAGTFLERTAAPLAFGEGEQQRVGDIVGRYTLTEKLGEGGCGVVYRAEQREPVRRIVALKVIKLGMDTRETVARFLMERQVLSVLNHPGIAHVFDAGSTAAGRPFFVMELVAGVPITRYCDERKLPVKARLELVERVCLAVQHAHQNGVIHRDIKPSNILVAEDAGAPCPKIIDFGIAKATQSRASDISIHTGLGEMIGTPVYMSPEQIEGSVRGIDTRSDIYSLGVLLYELLVGRTPFELGEHSAASLGEFRRLVLEAPPPRPSTRFALLPPADRAEIARARGTSADQLAIVLRGDLDWIAMRCLAGDRERRYESALALAQDLGRYLRREPISARPPEFGYRLRRFVARHRAACASAAAAVVALIASSAISIQAAVRARQAERSARAERDVATAAQAAERLARADALRGQEQAEELVTFMLGDFRAELKKVGQLAVLNRVGERALVYFNTLDARDLTDAALGRQATALRQLGEVRVEQALYPEAESAFTTAQQRAASLVARHPGDGKLLFERSQTEYWIGLVHWRRGDLGPATEWFSRYRDSAAALLQIDPRRPAWRGELAWGHHNLAVVELDRGRITEARTGFIAENHILQDLLREQPDDLELRHRYADTLSWLGSVAEQSGDLREAGERFAEMLSRIEALVQADPASARWRVRRTDALDLLAHILSITGRRAEALQHERAAIEALTALVREDAQNRSWLLRLLGLRLREARLIRAEGDSAQAVEIVVATRQQLERLAELDQTNRVVRQRLALACRLQAEMESAAGVPGADENARRAVELLAPLVSEGRANLDILTEAIQAELACARIAARDGDLAAADAHQARARDLLPPQFEASHYWRVLDAARGVGAMTGGNEPSREIVARLKASGYEPLDGWRESGPTILP